MINILDVQENKIPTNLNIYPMVIMAPTGEGKTYSMKMILDSLSDGEKKPLFIEFEDRYQHIPGIMAVRVHSIPELEQIRNQLKNPKAKEKYSCIVMDTADKLDTMIEKFVASSKEVEISGELNFGAGNKYIKSRLFLIDELRNLGWTVHFLMQSFKNTNIITQETTYDHELNKKTWGKISHDAYLIGMLTKDPKSNERLLTFKKTASQHLLKDSLNMPDVVKVSEFRQILEKAIMSIPGAEFTDEDTINPVIEDSDNFEEIKARGNELGLMLMEAGKVEEALNILKTNIGSNEDGSVKTLDSLIENQIDLAKLVVMKLEELVTKYGLNSK